jgi:hypothetical protein
VDFYSGGIAQGPDTEGGAAVNQFYEHCGSGDRVRSESHINFSEVWGGERGCLDVSEQEAELQGRFEAALERKRM